jgi:hypothetical protein
MYDFTHHKKVIDGADLMLELSIYPVAPATMQPTAKPKIMDAFFRNGEPKSSTRRMLTKDRKPRPMNWGEPHLHQVVQGVFRCTWIYSQERPRRRDVRAKSKKARAWPARTSIRAAAPVGDARASDKRGSNQ